VRFSCIACLILLALPRAHGQVFEVAGGSSSLYQAQGGTLSARGPSYDASIGAGVIAGRFVGGANITKMIGRSTYILGDDYIRFLLPTDIFDTSHYLIAQGVGVKTTLRKTAILGFAGALSNEFDSPLFEGARAQSGAGILFLTRPVTPTLTFASKMVFSGQTTAIESLDWIPKDKVDLAVSGGVGADQPYAAASLDIERPQIGVKAAYIEAGSRFHRVAVDTPLLSEPDRENIVVTVRPVHSLTVSAARQNYLTPIGSTETNARSSVDQVSGNLQLLGTSLNASLYHSSYLGESNTAAAFTADREFFSRLHATANYLVSRPEHGIESRSLVANFMEMLTPRWSVTEVVNRSQGQNSISFGGSFLSNFASVSAEYQTYYVPERTTQPFEQALIVDLQLHLLPGLSLHGATFVAPGGALSYTAEARDEFTRQSMLHPEDNGDVARGSIGNMMLRGQVLDVEGHPVAGAALMIDALVVYTNDDGLFYIREHKTHSHQIRVLVNQFLGGGVYRVVSAPPTTRSSYAGNAPETVVVVQKISAATNRAVH
jgi:hypothetical protein